MSFFYNLFGFKIVSEIECPELIPTDLEGHADIQFTLESLPARLEDAAHFLPYLQTGRDVFQFEINGVARYQVEAGSIIRVSPFSGALDADVRPYLLGSAMGGLLLQRRQLPLHVCAVAVDGHVHAFCGPSGAGKSTLAAIFRQRGLPLMCDDVGLAVPQQDGRVLFYPGFPRIKLWRDTLSHFSINEERLTRDFSRMNKFHMDISDSFLNTPLPMRNLYLLKRGDTSSPPRIEIVDRKKALATLIANTYRSEWIRGVGSPNTHLEKCIEVAESIRTFEFTRAWNLGQSTQTMDFLIDHMLSSD